MSYRFTHEVLRLKAFLGANGIRTSALETAADVVHVANGLFGLAFEHGMTDEESLSVMLHQQDVIAGMSYADRRILVRKNLPLMHPSVVSMAAGNKEKRLGKLRKRDRKHLARSAA